MERVYLMDVSVFADPSRRAEACAALSPYRRAKLGCLTAAWDRWRSLGAACVLDAALRPFALREREMTYALREGGKPYFKAYPTLYFSLSHAGSFAMCAISNRETGADLEQARDFSAVRRRFLEEELAAAAPLRLWTLKESYGKLTGRGVAVLDTTTLTFDGGVHILEHGVPADVSFWEAELMPGYRMAVCCAGMEPVRPEITRIGAT